jgi:hypothetical protein
MTNLKLFLQIKTALVSARWLLLQVRTRLLLIKSSHQLWLLGVTGLSFVLFAVLIFVEVKPEAKDILIYILGVLSAAVTQILSYYFGSSIGSKDKGDQLRSIVK